MTAFRFTQLSAVFDFDMNLRNFVRQVVVLKDGSTKVVWHKKKFNQPQYGDAKAFWKWQNEQPKPNSKRQQKLRLLPVND